MEIHGEGGSEPEYGFIENDKKCQCGSECHCGDDCPNSNKRKIDLISRAREEKEKRRLAVYIICIIIFFFIICFFGLS